MWQSNTYDYKTLAHTDRCSGSCGSPKPTIKICLLTQIGALVMWQSNAYDKKMLAHTDRCSGSCGSLTSTIRRHSLTQIGTLVHVAV
jgi:hypothetical protein